MSLLLAILERTHQTSLIGLPAAGLQVTVDPLDFLAVDILSSVGCGLTIQGLWVQALMLVIVIRKGRG